VAHVEKRSAGRWRARYQVDGRERSKTFPRRIDAERFLATVQTDLLRGAYVDPRGGRVTVAEYAERWMAGRVDLRPNTRERYASALRSTVLPSLGDRRLGGLQRSDIAAAVREWSTRSAPSTVQVVVGGILVPMLRAAVDDGLIARNPAERVPRPRVKRRHAEPLSPAAVVALAAAASQSYRVAIWLAAGAGLRQGETLGLLTRRVDFLRRVAHVEEQLQTIGGVAQMVDLKRAASRRLVPLDDLVLAELARHLEHSPAGPADLLIRNRSGQPIRRSSFGDGWRATVRRAGLPVGTRFHDLRHVYASTLIAAGVHPKVLQERLGHSSITETMDTYGHLYPSGLDIGRGAIDAHYAEVLAKEVAL
jgi:integrase